VLADERFFVILSRWHSKQIAGRDRVRRAKQKLRPRDGGRCGQLGFLPRRLRFLRPSLGVANEAHCAGPFALAQFAVALGDEQFGVDRLVAMRA
jgi:hypothetical protein